MTVVLMYHDIVADFDEAPSRRPRGGPTDRYAVPLPAFHRHLDAIADTGVKVELADADSARPMVALTFDDGRASSLVAAEELERRGWRGHFFITTSRIGRPGFLDAAEIVDLAVRGHQIGSHSHSHPTYMGCLTRTEIESEWERSRALLGEVLGTAPTTASVPGGFISRAVLDAAAKAGYSLLMTSEPTAKRRPCGGMLVLGRYAIRSTTSAAMSARYARGDRSARARLWVVWNAKQLVKRASPRSFEAARRLLPAPSRPRDFR